MTHRNRYSRRNWLRTLTAGAALPAAGFPFSRALAGQMEPRETRDNIKITRLETFLVKPRWIFLKIHTDAGITGLGEPLLEGRARTIATAISEIEPYLVGKDPRQVVQHWQAIYRHAFYRGGPWLMATSW